jgi:hypothetical protein
MRVLLANTRDNWLDEWSGNMTEVVVPWDVRAGRAIPTRDLPYVANTRDSAPGFGGEVCLRGPVCRGHQSRFVRA